MYVLEWFITLYTKALDLDIVSRVWDLFFLYGSIVIYKTGIGNLISLF